jgi:asparagine synthase (glutamine-hydrolysing)
VYYNDAPVSDPSALALFVLAEFARHQGMKVMLSGEGADELFGGYNAYYRYAAMTRLARLPVASHLGRWLARRVGGRNGDYLGMMPRLHYLGTGHLTSEHTRRQLLDADLEDEFERWVHEDRYGRFSHVSGLRQAMLFDQMVRLPDDILNRTDRATMAVSLETRVPFLDHHVVELANSLPDSWCLNLWRGPGSCKRILKTLLARIVPSRLVYRPKGSFELPIEQWLRGPFEELVRGFLWDRVVPGLNYQFLSVVYEAHRQGAAAHTAMLWAWLVLEKWYRLWILGQAAPRRPNFISNEAAYRLLCDAQ